MRRMALFTVLLSLLVLACHDGEEAGLILGLEGQTEVLRPYLVFRAITSSWEAEVRGDEITFSSNRRTERFRTPTRGMLTVEALLVDTDGTQIASGLIELDLRADWYWSVSAWLSDEDPTSGCMGCMGSAVFPVPDSLIPGMADSLHLVWGGNHIKDPVIY